MMSEFSENWTPGLKVKRKWYKRLDVIHKKRKAFIIKELETKRHYEDCGYHPCVITSVDWEKDTISGASLVTDSRISSCSLMHCGIVFFTEAEAMRRAEYIRYQGWDRYDEAYKTLAD